MTKIKRCYKGKPLDNINLKSGDSYHEGVENISNILAGDDLPDDIYLNFEDDDDEDCHPKKETLGCDDCRKDPDYIYCGKDLPVIGINNGDSYEDIFEAINNAIKECLDSECLDSTVLVKYENGDEIEFVTLSGGEHKEVIVPNCIPSEVQIYNSEGTLLQTITLEQGQSIGYTTPDSTAEIRYVDGTLITTVNIPSGETQTIYIPNCEPTITYIVDEGSNPLGEVVLESGTQGTFVCPNGTINVENSLGEVIGTGSVLSGGSGLVTVGDTNLVVEYADGTPITTGSIPSSTSDITITIPNCEDVEVTLENTAGLELDNETYASGTTNTMLAPDATYVLKDTVGATITTDTIPSGQSEDVIAPDATYTLTNTVPTTITSGNIVSNGSSIIIAPDATANLEDEDGNPISSTTIPSGSVDTLVALNGTVIVEYADGTPIQTVNVLSGGSDTVVVPICEDSTVDIEDTDGNTLYSLNIPSGSSSNQIINDSIVILKDTDGNTLSTTNILAESTENIIAPDANVVIEDQDGNLLGSGTALSGATTTINVTTPQNPVNYNVYKTGATVGIDGADNMGYGVDILYLDYPNNPNNPSPQYNRFINRGSNGMGGVVYMDYSTSRRKTPTTGECLAYFSTPIGGGDLNFINDEIHNLSIDVGGGVILDDWKMANIRQLINIFDYSSGSGSIWAQPFKTGFGSTVILSSTPNPNDDEFVLGVNHNLLGAVELRDATDDDVHAVAVCWIEFPML